MPPRKKNQIIDNGDGSKSVLVELKDPVNLATGSAVSRAQLGDDLFELASALSGENSSQMRICGGLESCAKAKIRKTIDYWENDPIVYKCITLLAYLANDTFTISSENKKVETALREWWRSIKGEDFLSHFFLEYFRSGNVPILKTKIVYTPRNGHKGGRYKDAKIPGGYTILNPMNISIKSTGIAGIKQAYLQLSDDFVSLLRDASNITKLRDAFPEEMVPLLKEGAGEIPLPNELFSMVTKDKQPYEEWALPLTSHAFDALDYRRALREMDRATASGVRNRILMVTIGNDMFPVTDDKELTKLASKFKNPSKNLTIFWNHTLKMSYVEPELDSLNIEKYQPALEDIRAVYGISRVLLGENGDSTGNNTLSLKGMMEILSEARNSFISWFFREVNDVANIVSNTREDEVTVHFGTLNLKDENDFFRVLMQMVDRQIISYETAMETMGYYFPKELKRLESEKKIREEKGILMTHKAPTQGGDNAEDPTNTGGRPKGGDKEGSRPESQNKPKTPSGIKSVSNLKKEVALALADNQSEEDIKNLVKEHIGKIGLSETKKTAAEYVIDMSDDFTEKRRANAFIDKIFRTFAKNSD